MGILKSVFKIPPSPPIQCCELIILLNASFVHCSSTFLRRGRGEKHKIVQIAVFPIIFVIDHKRKNYNTFFKEISENKILK